MRSAAKNAVNAIFRDLEVYSEEDYRRLPRRDRYVWDAFWFDTEVRNGGLRQFFTNMTGDHWRETLEALREIGEWSAASLLEEACSLFPDGRASEDQEARIEQSRSIWDDLKELEKSLGSYYKRDVFANLLEYWNRGSSDSEGSEEGGADA